MARSAFGKGDVWTQRDLRSIEDRRFGISSGEDDMLSLCDLRSVEDRIDKIPVGKSDLSIESDLRSVEEYRIEELEARKRRRRTKFST